MISEPDAPKSPLSGIIAIFKRLGETLSCVPKKSPPEETMDTIEAISKCMCRRAFFPPLGAILAAIVGALLAPFAFLYLGLANIPKILFEVQRLSYSKYKLYTSEAEHACKGCNFYLPYLIGGWIALTLASLLLPLLYPLAGFLQASYMMGKATYKRSNLYDLREDDGLLGGAFYSNRKEAAVSLGKWPCGIGSAILWLGDWFLLTGLSPGIKRGGAIYTQHADLFSTIFGIIDFVRALEDTLHILPLKTFFEKTKDAGKEALNSDAEKEDAKDEEESKGGADTPMKTSVFIGYFTMLVAAVFWPAVVYVLVTYL